MECLDLVLMLGAVGNNLSDLLSHQVYQLVHNK